MLPVNDAFAMQKLQSGHNFSGIETRSRLLESATLLNVEHEITAVKIFHYEE